MDGLLSVRLSWLTQTFSWTAVDSLKLGPASQSRRSVTNNLMKNVFSKDVWIRLPLPPNVATFCVVCATIIARELGLDYD